MLTLWIRNADPVDRSERALSQPSLCGALRERAAELSNCGATSEFRTPDISH
jgi:hypothetical protein